MILTPNEILPDIRERIRSLNPDFLKHHKLETLQLNLGNICNQCCEHCHIEASPRGNRIMPREIMDKIINYLRGQRGLILDITGGCPELNPNFKYLIEESHTLASRLIVRTNLTIFHEKGKDWLPEWYRDNRVVIIASLPCYTKENVDRQRGNGVFEKSIKALQKLNELGYGTSLELNLVYNPGGGFLPCSQEKLELDYEKHLFDRYGIRFNHLLAITNTPLGRFRNYLASNGLLDQYNKLLAESFNPDTVGKIMCRTLINVDWRGFLYNCDFNQAAGLPIRNRAGKILDIDHINEAMRGGHEIVMAQHCYCCTAGAGSSCTGILV